MLLAGVLVRLLRLECVDKTFCDIADEPLGQFQRLGRRWARLPDSGGSFFVRAALTFRVLHCIEWKIATFIKL